MRLFLSLSPACLPALSYTASYIPSEMPCTRSGRKGRERERIHFVIIVIITGYKTVNKGSRQGFEKSVKRERKNVFLCVSGFGLKLKNRHLAADNDAIHVETLRTNGNSSGALFISGKKNARARVSHVRLDLLCHEFYYSRRTRAPRRVYRLLFVPRLDICTVIRTGESGGGRAEEAKREREWISSIFAFPRGDSCS